MPTREETQDDEVVVEKAKKVPTIVKSVRFGGRTYVRGQEHELANAGAPSADLMKLQKKGVIANFKRVATQLKTREDQTADEAGEGEEIEIPTLAELPGFLQTIEDPAKIEAMAKADTRSKARAMYERRLRDLEVE